MLRKVSDPQLGRGDAFAVRWVQSRGNQLGERRFALTVGSKQRNPVVSIDPQVEIAQNRGAAISDRHPVQAQDRRG